LENEQVNKEENDLNNKEKEENVKESVK